VQVALDFHRLRERVPGLFFSPFVNKVIYGLMGVRDLIVRLVVQGPPWITLRPRECPSMSVARACTSCQAFAFSPISRWV
jgi:hypothetical protein